MSLRACPASGGSSPWHLPKTVDRPSEWVRRSARLLHPYPSPSAAAPQGHSAGVFEFCSGLVDLIVGVCHHGGGGHRLALAGERFVGRLTEDFAQVGDRGGATGSSGWGSSKNLPVLKGQRLSSRLAHATATSMDFDAPPSRVAVMRTESLWRAAPRVNEK